MKQLYSSTKITIIGIVLSYEWISLFICQYTSSGHGSIYNNYLRTLIHEMYESLVYSHYAHYKNTEIAK